jgi:CRISPR-associated exonuclease Cas4
MNYAEEDLLPLSAIQHLLFCERQCALIHIEGAWVENILTAKGRTEHRRADEASAESRGNLHIARGLPLRSFRLGLAGKADVVEFHRLPAGETGGAALPGKRGTWRPYPVEYKHGRPKPGNCDRAQLCAQAMCLEEMLNTGITTGALFYQSTRRREEVLFSEDLRTETIRAASRLHELISGGCSPPPLLGPRCRNCSLSEICLPKATSTKKKVALYIEWMEKGEGQ